MNDAVATIIELERRVMWRKRLLSLRDWLVRAAAIGGMIAAALMLVVRLRPIETPTWFVVGAAMGFSLAAALILWFHTRMRLPDAAFLIDESLDLEDRFATSRLIIEQGGPRRAVEEALIEDTADLVKAHHTASIAPSRTPLWYSLALLSTAGLAAVLMIPQRSLPITEALATERADIESAGEQLEQAAAEVEQAVPPGTQTATLAKEQAEVGRGFRRSTATRAEALRRLSALEERIRGRHDELASTRADEIVSLVDRRLGDTLPTLTRAPRKRIEQDENRSGDRELGAASKPAAGIKEDEIVHGTSGDKPLGSSQKRNRVSEPSEARTQRPPQAPEKANPADSQGKRRTKSEPQDRPQEPVSGDGLPRADTKNDPGKRDPAPRSADRDQKSTDVEAGSDKRGDQGASEKTADDQRAGEQPAGALDALSAVPKSLAEQAAKSLPKMSEELLKKAAELRANELSAADIEKLRKAAESLSRDLAQIAQSRELQQALQEMARQVRPEQVEQVARALGNQEKLRQELDAAAQLLEQNRQAKEMVAGLAGQFARMQDRRRQKDKGQLDGSKTNSANEDAGSPDRVSRNNRSNGVRGPADMETSADRRLAGQGREATLKGKLQSGSQGEYLYLQSKAGVGAARAPYSSAYPQYRREAERSVQHSQAPPGLRSVVRKYFDAINPDAKRP